MTRTNYTIYTADEEEISVQDFRNKFRETPDITIFISCYNEVDTVCETSELNLVTATENGLSVQIIFIDDGSSDGSIEKIKEWMRKNKTRAELVLATPDKNMGLGANFKFAAIMASGNSFRLTCGDLPEPKEALNAIYGGFSQGELVLPYHVTIAGKSGWRRTLSNTYTKVVNVVIGKRLSYYNGQPIIPTETLLQALPTTSGFGFQAEMVGGLVMKGYSFVEIPVHAVHHDVSTSVSTKNFLSVLRVLVILFMARMSLLYHSSRRK